MFTLLQCFSVVVRTNIWILHCYNFSRNCYNLFILLHRLFDVTILLQQLYVVTILLHRIACNCYNVFATGCNNGIFHCYACYNAMLQAFQTPFKMLLFHCNTKKCPEKIGEADQAVSTESVQNLSQKMISSKIDVNNKQLLSGRLKAEGSIYPWGCQVCISVSPKCTHWWLAWCCPLPWPWTSPPALRVCGCSPVSHWSPNFQLWQFVS